MQNTTKVDQSTIDENACQVISDFLPFLNKQFFYISLNPVIKVTMNVLTAVFTPRFVDQQI